MKLSYSAVLCAALFWMGAAAAAEPTWTEGVNFFLVVPARLTSVPPGKIEVTEAFSYACPACNVFQPTMHELKQSMPANVVVDYLPAAFNTAEDWPMFQLAYCTAQVLGVADQAHDAMFDAVWKGGDLSVIEPSTQRLKARLPSLEDAAKFYSVKTGVPVEKFMTTAKSFSVDLKVRTAQDLLVAYRVDRTPTIIVNGKYRLNTESAGGPGHVVDLVKYLVAKESR